VAKLTSGLLAVGLAILYWKKKPLES